MPVSLLLFACTRTIKNAVIYTGWAKKTGLLFESL